MINYVVELLEGQFSWDNVYGGLASKDLIPTITRYINQVVGEMAEAMASEGKNE